MFYHACRAGGCSASQAQILYAGVRIGTWASQNLPQSSFSANRLLFRTTMTLPFADETFLKGKLFDITQMMRALPAEATIAQLDNAIASNIKV